VILIDHHSDNPIQELESYLETFQNFTDNIAIGITHTDLLSESTKSTTIYKDWLLQNDLFLHSSLSMQGRKMTFFIIRSAHYIH
jgi:hypothetical protein